MRRKNYMGVPSAVYSVSNLGGRGKDFVSKGEQKAKKFFSGLPSGGEAMYNSVSRNRSGNT